MGAALAGTRLRAPAALADDALQVAAGARVYAAECASCHGTRLEGQPGWRAPGPDGMLPAPPHDASGHTWEHSDAQLYELVAHSVAATAPPGYRTTMPAYEGRLPPDAIRAVLTYIKAQWPPGIRAYQAGQNPGGPALDTLAGDWTFPPTCIAPSEDLAGQPTPP